MTQVRTSAQALTRLAKKSGAAVVLVGHVTKDGQIAGPRVVEHMVDAVLYFEGDSSHTFRILRGVKNRYGATDEIGVFAMTERGLEEVANPSALFLDQRDEGAAGSAVFAGMEGRAPSWSRSRRWWRPPRSARRAGPWWGGIRRGCRWCWRCSKRGAACGSAPMTSISTSPWLRIGEPAADLAVAAALISSLTGAPLPNDAVYFGEISLAGGVRPVVHGSLRLREAQKLGSNR